MEKLVLASANKHKIEEFNELLGGQYKILSLSDIGFNREIDETGSTLVQNAKIKAETVREFLRENGQDYPVIADDSGLFIHVLGGEPGVYSARYAGSHDDQANRDKVLSKMENNLILLQLTLVIFHHNYKKIVDTNILLWYFLFQLPYHLILHKIMMNRQYYIM